jgi:methionine-S-sulfoxide reductase
VWRTRVGYAGGTKESPTYESIGDHSEVVEVDFDPKVITYAELLDIFWKAHDPAARPYSRQYSSLVLAHDDAQLAAAKASAKRYQRATGRTVLTRIEKLDRFYLAEDYHQKHDLRSDPALMAEFAAMYPDGRAFVNSTAAARVNAYAAGLGSPGQLAREIGDFGLSSGGAKRVADAIGAGEAACPLPTPQRGL